MRIFTFRFRKPEPKSADASLKEIAEFVGMTVDELKERVRQSRQKLADAGEWPPKEEGK